MHVARRLQAELIRQGKPEAADRLALAISRADGRPLSPFRPVPADLRAAIAEGTLAQRAAALRAGEAPRIL